MTPAPQSSDRPLPPKPLALIQYQFLRRRAWRRILHACGVATVAVAGVLAFSGAQGSLWASRVIIAYAIVFALFTFIAWRCPQCGSTLDARTDPKACSQCGVQLHEERPVGTA